MFVIQKYDYKVEKWNSVLFPCYSQIELELSLTILKESDRFNGVTNNYRIKRTNRGFL